MHEEDDHLPPLHTGRRLLGEIGDVTVVLIDISLLGALVENFGELPPGMKSTLTFQLRGRDHAFACHVVRSIAQRFADREQETVIFHSEIRFSLASSEEEAELLEIVSSWSADAVTARVLNAVSTDAVFDGEGSGHAAEMLEPGGAADSAYLELRLVGDSWVRTHKLVGDQPPDGFTVSSFENSDSVEEFCRSYEEGDEVDRDLIRQFSRMSLIDPSNIPPRPPGE